LAIEIETNTDVKSNEIVETKLDTGLGEVDNQIDDKEISEPKQISDIEQKAIDRGWTPKDKFKGDLEDWEPAKKWLKKKERYDSITIQSKRIKEIHNMFTTFMEQTASERKRNADLQMERIQQEKEQAIKRGDVNAVNKIDEELDKYRGGTANREQDNTQPHAEEYTNFKKDNSSWFNDDTDENSAMKHYAIKKDSALIMAYPNMGIAERLEITKRMTLDFFNKQKPSSKRVEAQDDRGQSNNNKSVRSFNSLPHEVKEIIINFERNLKTPDPTFRARYIKSLQDTGAI